jgi:hypothetical protein
MQQQRMQAGLIIGGLGAVIAIVVVVTTVPGNFKYMFLGLMAVTIFILFSVLRPVFSAQGLLKSGRPAEATILSMWDTGTTVNNSPMVGFRLQVRPPGGGAPYDVDVKQLVNRLEIAQYQPGAVVRVMVHQTDANKVAIAGLAYPGGQPGQMAPGMGGMPAMAPSVMQPQAAEGFLQQIDSFNRALLARGESAPAVVLSAFPLGMNVNGNNPAMSFILDVRPAARASFQAEAKGVVAEASVANYQPGKPVWVKFDPADTTRVVIERSG